MLLHNLKPEAYQEIAELNHSQPQGNFFSPGKFNRTAYKTMMQFSFTFSFLSSVPTFQIPAQALHLVNRSTIEFLDWTDGGGLCKSTGHENAFRTSLLLQQLLL